MESELDLNDIIQEMHVIATMPDLYHLLVELNSVHSLLGLLSHENTDILSVMDRSRLSVNFDPSVLSIENNSADIISYIFFLWSANVVKGPNLTMN